MTDTLVVDETTLSTRQRAERLVQEAHENGCSTLDLTSVEFITRSVADEFRYFRERGEIEFTGLNGAAKEVYDVVSGQQAPA
jgi:hypothetical protein